MADVKWIKITTDMFDNRKIKHLRRMPDGNSLVLIWVMLLTMAGRCNSGGMIFLTENIPYTTKMLADELDFEENTVKLAITIFEQLGMIQTNDNGFMMISGWEEHQNAEALERLQEMNRKRVARHREKQKMLSESVTCNDECNVTETLHVTQCNAIEEDKEKDLDIRYKNIDYKEVAELYSSICVSFPSIRTLSDARKKAIKARLNTYSLEDFKAMFQKAEESDFLKGKNDRNWTADFDWLIKDANFAKVLEGKYDNKERRYTRKEQVPGWIGFQPGEAELEAVQKVLKQPYDDP